MCLSKVTREIDKPFMKNIFDIMKKTLVVV